MLLNRRTRLTTVLFALVCLLFMQLAVAGYVCSAAGPKVAQSAAVADSSTPCALSMAFDASLETNPKLYDAQPNLCKAHCQAGQQSADTYQPPLPVAFGALPAEFALLHSARLESCAPLQASHLRRTTKPPVAISNCCFRL